MSFIDRLDDLWNGVTDWLETRGESGRTELAGTITAKRVEGSMSDYSQYFVQISATELEVSAKQYESVQEGQEVVLTFGGDAPITLPDQMRRKRLIWIKPVSSLTAEQTRQVRELEELNAAAVQTRQARDLEAKKATDTRRRDLDVDAAKRGAVERCDALRGLGLEAHLHVPDTDVEFLGWIEIQGSPIGQINLSSEELGEYCYLPDSRLPDLDSDDGFVLGSLKVSSIRLKRYPVFGAVHGVRWRAAYPYPDGSDMGLGNLAANHLNQDAGVTESVIAAEVDVEVVGDGYDHWVVITKGQTVMEWTQPILACVDTVAQSILAMPLPEDS